MARKVPKISIAIGEVYMAHIGNREAPVRIVDVRLHGRGWDAIALDTGKRLVIRAASRLRPYNENLRRLTEEVARVFGVRGHIRTTGGRHYLVVSPHVDLEIESIPRALRTLRGIGRGWGREDDEKGSRYRAVRNLLIYGGGARG